MHAPRLFQRLGGGAIRVLATIALMAAASTAALSQADSARVATSGVRAGSPADSALDSDACVRL